MSEPKKLEDLSVLEINAEIGLRMEQAEVINFELRALRERRALLSKQKPLDEKTEPI